MYKNCREELLAVMRAFVIETGENEFSRAEAIAAMKRLKDVLAEAIYDTFNIPVHYTTLSENEYEEMYALRQEKQCVLFEYYHK